MLSFCYIVRMESSKPNDPLSRFALAIFYVNGLLMRNGDRLTRSIGQSSARWQVLGRAGYQPQTVAEMARDMGHARQSVQRIADVLAAEGLVTYVDNPKDKRSRLVALTPKGKSVLIKIYERNEEWAKQVIKKLTIEELTKAADVLEKIGATLEAENAAAKRQGNK